MNKTYVFRRTEIFVNTADTNNSLGTTDRLTSDNFSSKQKAVGQLLHRSPDILGETDDSPDDDYEPEKTLDQSAIKKQQKHNEAIKKINISSEHQLNQIKQAPGVIANDEEEGEEEEDENYEEDDQV